MKRITSLLLLAVAALAVAACGGKTLDTKNVVEDLEEITRAGGAETEVECPDEVSDADKGKEYECEITYGGNDGNKQTVQMKIGDDDRSEFVDQEKTEDEIAIRSIVARDDKEPGTVCEHVTEEVLEQLGGEDCVAQQQQNADEEPATIESLEIEGDTATMKTDKSTTTWERDANGAWVVAGVEQ